VRTPDARRDGVGWAYAGVLLGGAVSVAANVAHSFVPPAGVPPGWHPMRGAVLSAVFWPVSLFVALEILSRTTWPAGILWRAIRLGGLLPVAVVAAVVSYRHLSGLIRYYGEDGLTATFGPLAVDGLMIVASAALLASSVSPPTDVVSLVDEGTTPPADVARDAVAVDRPAASSPSVEATTGTAAPAEDGHRPPAPDNARAFVRAELAAGRSPSGAEVGRLFSRNSRWGQRIVRDVIAAGNSSADSAEILASPPRQPTETGPPPRAARSDTAPIDEACRPSETPSSELVPARSISLPAAVHTKALQSDGPPAGRLAGRPEATQSRR
jgi:hypothetical protein